MAKFLWDERCQRTFIMDLEGVVWLMETGSSTKGHAWKRYQSSSGM